MSEPIALGELASRLEQLECGENQQGPYVYSGSGKPVSGYSQMMGKAYASAIRAGERYDLMERDGVPELCTWILRTWGEEVSSASVRRVKCELLRRDATTSAAEVNAIPVTRAVELLNSPPAEANAAEGGKPGTVAKPESPADPFAELRQFARDELKGQERAVIEALCDAAGELPLTDLAVVNGVGWDDPFQGFKDAQRRLKPKLQRIGWTLDRQNNAGCLVNL